MAFVNLDNEKSNLLDYLNALQGVLGAAPEQAAAIDAVAVTTDLTGVDTGTDMTAAQAAEIEADLAALTTAVNEIRVALSTFGLIAASV